MRSMFFAALLAIAMGARGQDAVQQLETIAVTGEQPGPGLWKVSSGDHVLWILGTLSPLPRDIHWQTKELETRIAGAQEVLDNATVTLKADAGFFGTLALLPSLIGVRNNPDGAKLADMVPPELYARWLPLKSKYIGRSDRVEKWRPVFAALELYDAALERNHLSGADYVHKQALKAAKRAHIAVTTPKVEVSIEHPRDAITQFKAASVDDVTCFRDTLDSIDSNLVNMVARANAWATGDIAKLRHLAFSDGRARCAEAVSQTRVAREQGLADLDARVTRAWLDAARAALERNASTVALVPMRHLLESDGYLARLQAMGYSVEVPDGDISDTKVAGAK